MTAKSHVSEICKGTTLGLVLQERLSEEVDVGVDNILNRDDEYNYEFFKKLVVDKLGGKQSTKPTEKQRLKHYLVKVNSKESDISTKDEGL